MKIILQLKILSLLILIQTGSVSAQYCSGTTYLSNTSGSFSDGSGSNDYANLSDCKWLIQPANASSITLGFTSMDLSGADYIKIYDGSSTFSPLLATHDGSATNPPSGTVISTGGYMLIHFVTNSSYPDPGWDAYYTANISTSSYCSGTQTETNSSGTISDGSGSSNYNSNTDCKWLISPGTDKIVHLNFTQFQTENNYDFLKIYDGPSVSYPLLGSFSGSTAPGNISSTSGALLLHFTSDNLNEDAGWYANYYTTSQGISPCMGNTQITSTGGTITDGSGIDNYVSNSSCSWLIQPSGVSNISLSFNYLDTEYGYDILSIYDGSSSNANLIGNYSGSSTPSNIISSGNSLYLEFNSDTYVNTDGFSIDYSSSIQSYCTGTTQMLSAIGTFDDGSGSANNYADNTDCEWLIAPPGAMYITIDFNYFTTEYNQDILYVYDGDNTSASLLGTYSGNTSPASLTSSTGKVLVKFLSNASNAEVGWELDYGAIYTYCSGTNLITSTSGTIDDGSSNNDYGENSDCKWLIQPPGASSIILDFTSFDTELNADYVNVYDGSSSSATLLGSYSGSSIPSSINSSGGAILVHFISNGSVNKAGWELNYSLNNTYCQDTSLLLGALGSFDDGSGNNTYSNNSDCYWIIEPPGAFFIELDFTSFLLEQSKDWVHVYDGPNTNASLLGSYTGSLNPGIIQSTKPQVMIHFTSDNSGTSDGWGIDYEAFYVPPDFCDDTLYYSNPVDSFDDGSLTYNYNNNTDCHWLITADQNRLISIDFNYFHTEKNQDFLHIYDGNSSSENLIVSLTGESVPYTITSSSNSMFLHFSTNGQNNYDGWEIVYYTDYPEGVVDAKNNEIEIIDKGSYLEFIIDQSHMPCNISIFNSLGQIVYKKHLKEPGIIQKDILPEGLSFISIFKDGNILKNFRMFSP